jgi:predicted flap endonuclease-1-like 5' DNA nuclease
MEFKARDRIIWKKELTEFVFVRDGSIKSIDGIGPKYAKRLKDAFVDSHEDLIDTDAAELADETGISENLISDWQKIAEEQTEEV